MMTVSFLCIPVNKELKSSIIEKMKKKISGRDRDLSERNGYLSSNLGLDLRTVPFLSIKLQLKSDIINYDMTFLGQIMVIMLYKWLCYNIGGRYDNEVTLQVTEFLNGDGGIGSGYISDRSRSTCLVCLPKFG